MKTLSLLILSLLSFSTLSLSNIDCVLEKISALRLQTSLKADSSQSHSTTALELLDLSLLTSAELQRLQEAIRARNTARDYQPLTVEQATREALLQTVVFLRDENKRIAEQLCMPFTAELRVDRLVAAYFCNRLLSERTKNVNFLLTHWDLGAAYFGALFQQAGGNLPLSFLPAKASERQRILTTFAEKTKFDQTFHDNLGRAVEFHRQQFDAACESLIDEVLLKQHKKELGLDAALKAILGRKEQEDAGKKAATLLAAFNMNLSGRSPAQIKKFKELLGKYEEIIKEKPNSIGFRRLQDKIFSLVDSKRNPHETDLQNFVEAPCFATMAKLGRSHPVTECRQILANAFKFDAQSKILFNKLLENFKFVGLVSHFVQKNLLIYKRNHIKEFEVVALNINQDIYKFIQKIHNSLQNLQTKWPQKELFDFAPLAWDFRRFEEKFGSNVWDFLAAGQSLSKYAAIYNTSIYSSAKISDFVGKLKKEVVRHFNMDVKELNRQIFNEKFARQCEKEFTGAFLKACENAILEIDFDEEFLPLRHGQNIFEYLVSLLKEELEKFDPQMNDSMKLLEIARGLVKSTFSDLHKKFKKLTNSETEFDKNIKSKKLLSFFVTAKQANLELNLPFVKEIWPIAVDWIEKQKSAIIAFNLKDEEFSELSIQLRDKILESFRTVFSARLAIKNLQIIKETFLTTHAQEETLELSELRTKIFQLFKHYDSFPEKLKTELQQCIFEPLVISEELKKCAEANKKDCVRVNPFLIVPACADNFTSDLKGNCLALCPEGFPPAGNDRCLKPKIEFADFAQEKIGVRRRNGCPVNFEKVGLICVPRCPLAWKDFGAACGRPVVRFGRKQSVLLVK